MTQQKIQNLKTQLFEYIEENDFLHVFELLKNDSNFKGYQNLKDEWVQGGPQGQVLTSFKERLKTFISDKYDKINLEQDEKLCIVVLTSTETDWDNIKETIKSIIPLSRYGKTAKNWKPFKDESIETLLEHFVQQSEITINQYYHSNTHINSKLRQAFRKSATKIILITDPFSFKHQKINNIVHLFDDTNKESIGGCIIPVCNSLTKEQSIFAQERIKETFKDLSEGWRNELCKSYAHVELNIPTKGDFFRRLANIAFFKDIPEKDTTTTISLLNNKYNRGNQFPVNSL